MSEATTIDTLELEVKSNAQQAADGIYDVAVALEALKSSGKTTTAINNLKNLSDALSRFTKISDPSHKINALTSGLKALSKVEPVKGVTSSIKSLAKAVEAVQGVELGGIDTKFSLIASAANQLSGVKAGGLGNMVNALGKIGNVTESLDDEAIDKFASRVKRLNDVLEPLSGKMTTIQAGLRGVNSKARTAGNGMSKLGGKVNTTTLNLSSMIHVLQGVQSALQPVVRLLTDSISAAIEWDGISSRFGRGFGESTQETYEWVQRLNEEMGINTQQFMQYSSTYATMLTGFGVESKDAYEMALGYTELTYDIWAGYNDIYKTYQDAADAVRSAIAGEVEPIRRAGFTIVEATLEQTAANHGLSISLEKATEAQKSYLRYLTMVDQANATELVGAYAREMNTAEGLMRTFSQQLKSLAQAFGSLFLPVLVKVMPWVQAFVELLSDAIALTASFFGIEIQPVSWSNGSNAFDGLGDSAGAATESIGGTTDAVDDTTKALKELKNATLGIDELNVISPPDPSSASGNGSGLDGLGGIDGGFGSLDIESLWDESIFDQIQFEVDEIKSKLKEALSGITAVISGFMLAIGTILVVSGANIPLGLGLMAMGAVGLVAMIAENWGGMSQQLAKTLTTVTSIVGGFLLAVGAFLVFSGVNVPLGAALMVAGAVSLGTAATINWKFLEGDMKNALSVLTGIVSGGLLAMGALFAFTGVSVPLGIALMAAGAVSLATTVGLNWESLSEPMRKAIGTLEMIVGSALLSFGAILAFSGANIPLGIGLIAAGAVSILAAEQLNWDSLNGTVKNKIATLTTLVSGAALGLGAVLAFSGVALPVGIALMAAGAVGIIAAAPVNWESLTHTIVQVTKELGIAVGGSLLALGAVLAFSGVALPVGIALMAAGAIGLVSGVALNWSSVVSSVTSTLKEIGIVAGTALLGLGLLLCLSGVGIPLGLALIAAGAVGLVSGVALNWGAITQNVDETVTDVGNAWDGLWDACVDGVKKMKDGVIEWFTELWDELVGHSIVPDTIDGIVDCFLGLPGKVLGSVGKFVGDIIGKFSDFGTKVVDKIKSGWGKITSWFSGNSVKENVEVGVSLVKSGWSSIKNWIGKIPTISQAIGLVKSKWSTVKKWIGSVPKINQNIGLAKSGWSSVKSWIGTMPKLSAKIGLVKNGWSSIKSWLGNLSYKLDFKLPKIGINWGKKTVFGFTISYPSSFYTYAKGGFPDIGEMFIARERGPELVGKIGSKTTVANNEQIIEGVSEGVYAAVLAAMQSSESGNNGKLEVYLDGRQLDATVRRRERERGASLVRTRAY